MKAREIILLSFCAILISSCATKHKQVVKVPLPQQVNTSNSALSTPYRSILIIRLTIERISYGLGIVGIRTIKRCEKAFPARKSRYFGCIKNIVLAYKLWTSRVVPKISLALTSIFFYKERKIFGWKENLRLLICSLQKVIPLKPWMSQLSKFFPKILTDLNSLKVQCPR